MKYNAKKRATLRPGIAVLFLTAHIIAPIDAFGVLPACTDSGYHAPCWKFREGPGCEGEDESDSAQASTPGFWSGQLPGSQPGSRGGCASCNSHGMPQYWIAESFLNLRLEDVPLGYSPAIGPKVFFHLSYRQRGVVPEEDSYFSVGTNWSCSFRAYVFDHAGGIRLHRNGAGFLDYADGVPHFRDGSVMRIQTPGASYVLERPNGAKDYFQSSFTAGSGQTLYFLTQRVDPAGNALTFTYTNNNGVFQLATVTDADGKITKLYYENGSFPNRITKVVDPFLRTNRLAFDHQGYLTNITDVEGLSSGFIYDTGTASHRGWITNMVTPYGSTAFRFGGSDVDSDGYGSSGVNRFVEVTLPTGGKELYLFRKDCSAFMSNTEATAPSTSPFANTFDDQTQSTNNTFYWSPLQYAQLWTANPDNFVATNYVAARMRHWLVDNPVNKEVSETLAFERAPSQDGSTPGQYTWFDHPDKSAGEVYTGSSKLPSMVALTLPDSNTRFTRLTRNSIGAVTNAVSTYTAPSGSVALRTNRMIYASNEIDLKQHIGPNNEQVVSNYFNNVYHQADASYDALFQETRYTYNAARQLIKVVHPTGLTTTNIFLSSADGVVRLAKTIDLEIGRSNSFTYAKGLVDSHTDARGLTTTNYWDNLQRLTGIKYPDGTTISNRYTVGTGYAGGSGSLTRSPKDCRDQCQCGGHALRLLRLRRVGGRDQRLEHARATIHALWLRQARKPSLRLQCRRLQCDQLVRFIGTRDCHR
ncbi:MAG TPA: hypothetical protein VFZ59_07555 [Verrucomicrobiae bacterium]|nr:hypothetical protein [Verrucomicrobiae bacterium]